MGWRGVIRSIGAAARAAERESNRRRKQELKEQMYEESADAVAEWEEHLDKIRSIHTNLKGGVDWAEIAGRPAPEPPTRQTKHFDLAQEALKHFKPSFFHIFVGGSERRLKSLKKALADAPALDDAPYNKAMSAYEDALRQWNEDTQLARNVISGNVETCKNVISEYYRDNSSDGLIGVAINVLFCGEYVHAIPEIHSDKIIPDIRRKQLASGKLSETKMPISQRNELYKDYVASVALRVAVDIFNLLPLEEIYVTCTAEMLDSKTGHMRCFPIVSVKFVRSTLKDMNLSLIDPSDSLDNFVHVMNFRKTKGFSPIEPLKDIEQLT